MSERLPVCFLGKPWLGSVAIRAKQIAEMRPHWRWPGEVPDSNDILACELFCFVKFPQPRLMRFLRRLGKRVVLDVLDSWSQPEDDRRIRDRAAARAHFAWLGDLPLDGVIFPNGAMREHIGDLVPNPVTIYHHYRPGLRRAEVRKRARRVGYEGDPRYLGEWRLAIERACAALDLEFVVNPRNLSDVDIGFAARGAPYAAFLSCNYKSNVKLANFYGAGLPCLVGREASYVETDEGSLRFCSSPRRLTDELRALVPYELRLDIHERFLAAAPRFSIGSVSRDYETYFAGLLESAPTLA